MFAGLLCFFLIFLPIVVTSGFSLYESWQERFNFVESQCSFVRGEVKTIRSRQTEDVSQENVQYQLRLDVMVHTQEKNQIATGIHNNKTYHSYDDAFNALDAYKKSHNTIPCWHEPGNFVDIKIVRNSFWQIIMQLLTIFIFAPLLSLFLFIAYQAPSSEA